MMPLIESANGCWFLRDEGKILSVPIIWGWGGLGGNWGMGEMGGDGGDGGDGGMGGMGEM
jgi:hypothetical protein